MEKRLEDSVDVDRTDIMQYGTILVYITGINRLREADDAEFENCLNRIPQWRRQRILSYRNRDDRLRSLACSLFLAVGCAELGWNSQGYIGTNGRPMLSEEGHYISLAHAGDYAVAAFSQEPVGIDVEETRRFTPERREKMGRKILTSTEQEYLQHPSKKISCNITDCNITELTDAIDSEKLLMHEDVNNIVDVSGFGCASNINQTFSCTKSDSAQSTAFACIWTRKEAYVKRNGKGLSMDFREIETMQEELFYSCALGEDYVMSVCGSNLADIREVCIY